MITQAEEPITEQAVKKAPKTAAEKLAEVERRRAALKEERAELKAALAQKQAALSLAARKIRTATAKADRKLEARRAIVLGQLLLRENPDYARELVGKLTRDQDKALFEDDKLAQFDPAKHGGEFMASAPVGVEAFAP